MFYVINNTYFMSSNILKSIPLKCILKSNLPYLCQNEFLFPDSCWLPFNPDIMKLNHYCFVVMQSQNSLKLLQKVSESAAKHKIDFFDDTVHDCKTIWQTVGMLLNTPSDSFHNGAS